MALWAPGCRIQTFEDDLTGSAQLERFFLCDHLPTVTVRGHIHPIALLEKKPAEIIAYFVADWECTFFRETDCLVPTLNLGTVTPDDTGHFEIQLPNFSDDPVASAENVGEWQFVLRDPKTWNRIAGLYPEDPGLDTPSSGLRVLLSYPADIRFGARRIPQVPPIRIRHEGMP